MIPEAILHGAPDEHPASVERPERVERGLRPGLVGPGHPPGQSEEHEPTTQISVLSRHLAVTTGVTPVVLQSIGPVVHHLQQVAELGGQLGVLLDVVRETEQQLISPGLLSLLPCSEDGLADQGGALTPPATAQSDLEVEPENNNQLD